MNKQSKRNLSIVLLSLATLVAGGSYGAFKWMQKSQEEKEAEKQKLTVLTQKLEKENRDLENTKTKYKERRKHYASNVALDSVNNPDFDNIESLYKMANKVSVVAERKYSVIEKNFVKKCSRQLKQFAEPSGLYIVHVDGSEIFSSPVNMEDWMLVAYENSNKIKNFKALESEYNDILFLRDIVWEYVYFIQGDFSNYVFDKSNRAALKREHTLVSEDKDVSSYYVAPGNVYDLTGDKIYRYNDKDNVKQDQIIKALIEKYLVPFYAYSEKGLVVIDKASYRKINELASVISNHNTLESGVVSYDEAIKKIDDKISANAYDISVLKQKTR